MRKKISGGKNNSGARGQNAPEKKTHSGLGTESAHEGTHSGLGTESAHEGTHSGLGTESAHEGTHSGFGTDSAHEGTHSGPGTDSAHEGTHSGPGTDSGGEKKTGTLAGRSGIKKTAVILSAIILTILLTKFIMFLVPCPELNAFSEHQYSTRFYDRKNILLEVMPLEEGLRREYVELNHMPPSLINAFILSEDRNFYRHHGVDFGSLIRAAIQNSRSKKIVSGASTITMQLVRLVYPRKKNEPVTIKTKLTEMIKALWFETKLSKKKILELYLNNVPFGFQIEGVASAARSFFAVEVQSLNQQQNEILAQIPRRPSDYAPEKIFEYPHKCPHFINYVRNQYEAQGKKLPAEIKLTVDSTLCEMASTLIEQKIMEFSEARIKNGSAFVINNRTGDIFAWVGNGNFSEENGAQIDGVLVKNQPGSSMKPFLYAMSLENGFRPADILPDIQQDFGGEKVYVPLNFNNRYNGPVKMRVALASSLNIPAVYLLYHLGVSNYLQKLDELGFSSLKGQRSSTGLSIALGSSEVTLYEMVRAFSVFTRDGLLPEINYLYSKNENSKAAELTGTKAYEKDTARILCDFLSDKSARELGFGHAKVFDTKYPSMFKTGTSNQFQNIIALGATTEFTAGVWMGNFEGETVIQQTGSSIPATIVREMLDRLTEESGAQQFIQPESYEKKEICSLSGMLKGPDCPSVNLEYYPSSEKKDGILQKEMQTCTWHKKINGRLLILYPPEYQHWSAGQNMWGKSTEQASHLEIMYPTKGATFIYDESIPGTNQRLLIQVIGGVPDETILYLDNEIVPSSGRLRWSVPLTKGRHEIRTVCKNDSAESYFVVK